MKVNNNFSCIYSIVNVINNKIYIGSAVNFRKRIYCHLKQLETNKHHSKALQRAYNKYGKDSFEFQIIENVKDKTQLIQREQNWMNLFNPEYNCCKTAGSVLGLKMSDYVKSKLKEANIGRVPWNKGKKFEETYTSEEVAHLKIRMSPKGRVVSKETREKLSKIRLGKPKIKNRKPIVIKNINTKEETKFDSSTACAHYFKVKVGHITRVLRGHRPHFHKIYNITYQDAN